jgi:hypothetical protein
MNTAVGMLLNHLTLSRQLMLDSVCDLSTAELSWSPSPDHRSCAQLLGVATVADREVLRRLNVDDLPDVPAGFEMRFALWGFGDDSERAGDDSSMPVIFAAHRDALIRTTAFLDSDRLDVPVGPNHLDEEAMFPFETTGEMILATSAYTSFLVGKASSVRLALGRLPVEDPIVESIGGFTTVSGSDR